VGLAAGARRAPAAAGAAGRPAVALPADLPRAVLPVRGPPARRPGDPGGGGAGPCERGAGGAGVPAGVVRVPRLVPAGGRAGGPRAPHRPVPRAGPAADRRPAVDAGRTAGGRVPPVAGRGGGLHAEVRPGRRRDVPRPRPVELEEGFTT